MKKQWFKPKQIIRLLVILLMLASLALGIGYSATRIKDISLANQYKGGYQALVTVSKTDGTTKGIASEGADALESKLSPFKDGSVDIKELGNNHLRVTVPNDAYNNEQEFKNAITSSGGLFVLDSTSYEDIMTSSTYMSKIGIDNFTTEGSKIALSDVIGSVSYESKKVGNSNEPYLTFDLPNDNWSKIVAEDSDDDSSSSTTTPSFTMVANIDSLLENVRSYYNLASSNDTYEYYKQFYEGVIVPLRNYIKTLDDQSADGAKEKNILLNLFAGTGTYYANDKYNTWNKTYSLLDSSLADYIHDKTAGEIDFTYNVADGSSSEEKAIKSLQSLLSADGTSQNTFKYSYDIMGNFAYDANSVAADFAKASSENDSETTDGKYSADIADIVNSSSTTLGRVDTIFPIVTKDIFSKVLNVSNGKITTSGENACKLNADTFANNFIFTSTVTTQSTSTETPTSVYIDYSGDSFNVESIYNDQESITFAKTIEAQIKANTQGLSFSVEFITRTEESVSNVMLILSIITLSIIALCVMIFLLFFYRLLGLFTIIVSLCIGGLSLLMFVLFGLPLGPESFITAFVSFGIIVDISVMYFESLKNNLYSEKRSIESSFKITNRETLGISIDITFCAILPSLILFWIGSEELKNFATINVLSLLSVFVIGIVLFRMLVTLIVRTGWIKKTNSWALPIDTKLENKKDFWLDYSISTVQNKLDSYSNKEKMSSKDLLRVKELKDKLESLLAKKVKRNEEYNKKQQIKAEKIANKLNSKVTKLENKNEKNNLFTKIFKNKLLKNKHGLLAMIGKKTSLSDSEFISENKVVEIENKTSRIGIVLSLFTTLFFVLSIIIAFVFGLNYSSSFGRGTNILIRDSKVSQTLDAIKDRTILDNSKQNDDNWTDFYDTLDSIIEFSSDEDENDGNVVVEKVADVYKFLLTDGIGYSYIVDTKMQKLDFDNLTINYGYDSTQNNTDGTGMWISIDITNDIVKNNIIIKDFIMYMSGNGTSIPTTNYDDYKNNPDNYSIWVFNLKPHTAYSQMKEILITFGVVLAALLIYMIIRFKWTYYVALAIGILFISMLVVGSVILFRIPVSIEILSAAVGVISFALITGILILGKAKSIFITKDEKTLHSNFDAEIDLIAEIRDYKKESKLNIHKFRTSTKEKIKPIKEEFAETIKNLIGEENVSPLKVKFRWMFGFINKKNKHTEIIEAKKIKNEYKQEVKKIKLELKDKIASKKVEVKLAAKKNNFLKEIFASTLKFGFVRSLTVGIIYLAIAIVLMVTMPSVAGMGAILMIGVVASTVVVLTIVLPIWIWLEQKRIRTKYGFKKYVTRLHVSDEEQIIADIND